ncbi:MAG: nitroreductase [Pikeienuella sp.]
MTTPAPARVDGAAASVSEALASRMSCRAFLPDPVPGEMVRTLLEKATQAPSGGNLQPWHIYALGGDALEALKADVREAQNSKPMGGPTEYEIYPNKLKDPYNARRRKCGEDMYAAINVPREDKLGRLAQFKRNFELFDAPVGIFLYLDRTMGPPQWSDAGMYLQSLMLLAREAGLHTCAQEAWALWHQELAAHLNPPEDLMLFCGVALGWMDRDAPINTVKTDRDVSDDVIKLTGF